MTKQTEIAASTNGFIRIVQIGGRFEVQTKRIRGEQVGALTYWHTLAGFWDQNKAFAFYQCHA